MVEKEPGNSPRNKLNRLSFHVGSRMDKFTSPRANRTGLGNVGSWREKQHGHK